VRKTLLSALAVAVLLGTSSVCPAQNSASEGLKPLVTISFSGYDELFSDIGFIGKLSDNPELSKGLEAMLKMLTQGKGLTGLDTKRPWGAVIETDGQNFPVHGFVPVTELKPLLEVLGPHIGEAKDAGDGVFEIQTQARPVFVKQKGDWAFICPTKEALDKVPDDPTKVLGGLNEKYDLAVRVAVKNVPPPFRQMLAAQLQLGAQAGMQQMPDESDEQYAIRTKVAKQMLEQTTTVINELDSMLIGFAIDSEAGTSYLDVEITALEGTKTAEGFAKAGGAKTNFAGFLMPEAALTANWSGKLADSDIAQSKAAIETMRAKALAELDNQGLSDEETKQAKQLLDDLMDVILKTIESGTIDGGAALMLGSDTLTLLAGGYLADGAKLEKVFKDLVALAKEEDPAVADVVKLDAEKHQGVSFHALTLPMPPGPDTDKIVPLVGEQLNAVVGIGEKEVYLSLGRDAAAKLKEAIDKSKAAPGKEVPPMQLSVAVGPIAKFVAQMGEEDARPIAAMIAAALEQAGGKDHVTLVSTPVERGVKVKLEIEEGILKVLGSLSKQAVPGGPPPGAPGF